ncbi:MAG: hypothetical protein ABSE40_18015 [Candidatus Sulfotelmatobacter sp.]|jgi:hypothetical protein
MKRQTAMLAKFEVRLPIATMVVLLVLQTPLLMRAQGGQEEHIGLPIDWSSHHIIFTNGASPEVAGKQARDPRSWINWAQRSAWMFPREGWSPLPGAARKRHMRVDWAVPLGANGGMPLAESPAKYNFNVNSTPSCANDFVVYTIAANPSATQANLVAFNNLYTGTTSSSCPTANQSPVSTDLTQPTFLWAYAMGSEGSALSPTISISGTKVAFVETGTATTVTKPAYFDVVTPVSGQGSSATSPCVIASAGSSLCGGTTLVRLNYTNSGVSGCGTGTTNSNSSAYIDYGSDSAYIGADNGILYRISGVFKGTPAVQYCVQVGSATAKLTSPVYDEITGEVFVSDGFTVYAYSAGTSGFTKLNSVALASTSAANGDPIILSPIVDTTNGFVYVFSSADSTDTNSIVAQFKIQANGDLGTPVTAAIGPAGTNGTTYIFDGDFDNAYVTSGPTTGAGTLYACGTQTGAATLPSLYALSFQSGSGTMNSTPAMSNNKNIYGGNATAGICSPLLEFYNSGTDYLFVGAGNIGNTNGANLVTGWNVTSRIASNTTAPNSTATNEWGGTSAFSVDNVSTEDQAASIYFGTLQPAASGTAPSCPKGQYCAIKLTQSGLQ